jgi:hypothetical protein
MAFKLVPAEQVLGGSFLGEYQLAGTYLQSPNYVPGVSGWAIFGDGSAEFNNGTFRGLLEAASLILAGSSGEILIYSGPPAAGNLIFSVSAVTGTDGEGNNYGSGLNAGDQTGGHLAISTAGDLLIANGSDAPVLFAYHGDGSLRFYSPAGITAGDLAVCVSPAAGSDSAANGYAAGLTGPATAIEPGSSPSVPETWHAATLVNSWTAVTTLEYQVTPDGFVHLSGQLTVPAGAANPSTIATLPAGYAPARNELLVVCANESVSPYTSTAYPLRVETSGILAVYGAPPSGYSLSVQGRYPLAA